MKLKDVLRGVKKLRGRIVYLRTSSFKWKVTIDPKNKEIRLDGRIPSVSEGGNHKPSLRFKTKFSQEKTGKFLKKNGGLKTDIRSKTWYFLPVTQTSPLIMGCTCADWNYTWAYWNKRIDSTSVEKGREYVPPEGGISGDRPERNPLHIEGACKHILGLVKVAREQGYLVSKI